MSALRSFLLVPGDSEQKLGKVAESEADAVILDLEDSVSAARKSIAREMVGEFLSSHAHVVSMPQLWVRVNSFGSGSALADLAATVTTGASGIMIPKVGDPADVLRVHHYVEALEESASLETLGIELMPVATGAALTSFRLGDYATVEVPRMYGLTWVPEVLGAPPRKSKQAAPDGEWAATGQLLRSRTLCAARAFGVEAVATPHMKLRDAAGLAESSHRARAEGFSGRIAIHPEQVRGINEVFTPSAHEVALTANEGAAECLEMPFRLLNR